MKRFMIIIGIVALSIVFTVYHQLTRIRYDEYRAHISSIYCSLAGEKNIPQRPVIFVPGIKGSMLEHSGSTVWLTLRQLLGGSSTLRYAPDDDIQANGIFDRLIVAPFFLEYRSYYEITAQMACAPKGYVFWYDWRGKPQQNADDFERLVNRVIAETGQKPSVIAHSMGGLIVHSVVKKHPEKFDRVVYVTVPFNPGVGYLDDLNEGAPTLLNKTLMSKEVIFSQPSSFLLLPHKGSGRYKRKELFDPQTWKEEKLSTFADGAVDIEAFKTVLEETSAYHALLDAPGDLSNPTLLIVGATHPTVYAVQADGTRTVEPGDGRVSYKSAFPVDRLLNQTVIETTVRHTAQLNDSGIIKSIFDFVTKQ